MKFRCTEEWEEYEASDNHHQALLERLGLSEESKTIHSAAVKPEEIGQEQDEERKDEFRSLAATLNYMSLDVRYAAKEKSTKIASPTRGSWKIWKKARR